MTALIDIVSPIFLGEDRISVSVDPSCEPLLAFGRIIVNFDYSDAEPEGVVLPLEFEVQPAFGGGGKANGYRSEIYRREAPDSATFTVPSAGEYLVSIREMFHNQWHGKLVITVGGDPLSTESLTTRG